MQTTDLEGIFTNSISDREVISKICKDPKKLNINNPNNPNKKWDTELNREFSLEVSQMAEKHVKKC